MPRYFNHLSPVSGLIPLLDELSSRGLPMAIVSNWAPSLPKFLDHHGFTRYFDPIVYSAQDGIHKPDHRIFQRALDGLGIPAERAIFIGDNPELDIAPARKMGMRAINFDPSCKYQSRDADDAAVSKRQVVVRNALGGINRGAGCYLLLVTWGEGMVLRKCERGTR